jgi:hypothetical protein
MYSIEKKQFLLLYFTHNGMSSTKVILASQARSFNQYSNVVLG